MNISRRRIALKVMGVMMVILGSITLYYTLFVILSIHFIYTDPSLIQYPNVPQQGFVVLRNEYWVSYFDVLSYRTYHFTIGFIGVVLMFMGYKSYRFIPYSERED